MRILWLCNIVLPELAGEFGFRKVHVGGWMTGAWEQMKSIPDMELGICVPIIDENRMKEGIFSNYHYYSFHFEGKCACLDLQFHDFEHILEDFKPDVVHIWGTEYQHSYSMIKMCQRYGLKDKVIVNVQGLVAVYAKHLRIGLPEEVFASREIKDLYNDFIQRGELEEETLREAQYVMGRTCWDQGCVTLVNPKAEYIYCGEILRKEFYEAMGRWNLDDCEPHSIFISQANYPIKGFHLVLEELGILNQLYSDLTIYVAGQFPQKDESEYGRYIYSEIKKYHLKESLHFVGKLSADEMISYYCKANVFLSASTIENSSNSVCEAMMIGLPVVASCVGGLQSIIEHGKSGFLYPLNEPYMMRTYIMSIFDNSELARNLSKQATDFVREYNNIERITKTIIDTYRRLSCE